MKYYYLPHQGRKSDQEKSGLSRYIRKEEAHTVAIMPMSTKMALEKFDIQGAGFEWCLDYTCGMSTCHSKPAMQEIELFTPPS